MDNYIEISFNRLSPEENEIMIALLTNLGFEAFEEQDELLKGFVPEASFRETQLKELAREKKWVYTKATIAQKNWNEIWEHSFEPVIIGRFCAIRAAFHPPVRRVKYEIIITPKMSFGTGHHATTSMMIEAMKDVKMKGKQVLDFGTGTGVLAILAEKMGATSVDAIDNDDWSIENAKENIRENSCNKIHLSKAGLPEFDKRFDLILANINKNVILAQLPAMRNLLGNAGIIFLSGILEEDLPELQEALTGTGLMVTATRSKKNWICLQCKQK